MKNKTKPNQGWKYLSLIMTIFAFSGQSFAYDFLVDGIYYKITNSSTNEVAVTLKSYTSGGRYGDTEIISDYAGSVVIPSSVVNNGIIYSVTGIDNFAFDDSDVTSVSIPNTIKTIGNSAFAYCLGLTTVTIPSNVTRIGNSAFQNCRGLTSFTIPGSVTSIGNSAFQNCSGLTIVTIPGSVTSIGNSAFQNCSGLTSVTIPNSVNTIGNDVFRDCTSLTAIQIPSSVTSFGSCVLTGTGINTPLISGSKLIYCPPSYEGEYHIPMGITEISGGAFYGCTKLTKVIIPHGVKRVNDFTFSGCSSLGDVSLPVTLVYVGQSAFQYCSSLKECILPPSVSNIYDSAFSGCTSLTSIVLPASMTNIRKYVFDGCKSLKTVVFPAGVTNIWGLWAFSGTPSGIDGGLNVFNFASCLQGQSEGPTGLSPTYIHVPKGWQDSGSYSPISGELVYDLESISSISISNANLNLTEGDVSTLSCSILPSTASVKTLHWSSNNTDVAIVDNNGKVTAIADGSAIITVSSLDGSNLSQKCEVNVEHIPVNNISITDVTGIVGCTFNLPISMTNEDEITAMQFELSLPEGVSVADATLTDRKNGHSIDYTLQENGNYQFTVFSSSSKAINGNEGDVANISLNISNSVAPGNYTIQLKNIELTTTSAIAILQPDLSATLTVSNIKLGDVNGDDKMSITDAVGIVNYILGNASSNFHPEAADVNGDNRISITDAVALVNIILNQSATVKEHMMQKMDTKKEPQ